MKLGLLLYLASLFFLVVIVLRCLFIFVKLRPRIPKVLDFDTWALVPKIEAMHLYRAYEARELDLLEFVVDEVADRGGELGAFGAGS